MLSPKWWLNAFCLIGMMFVHKMAIFCDALSCYSCASRLLRSQWQATGLPTIPSIERFHFDDRCADTGADTLKISCNSVCFEMLLVAGNEYTAVRGCLSDFYKGYNMPNLIPKCYYADYEQNLTILENGNASELNRVYVGTRYCNSENCNNELATTGAFAKDQTNWQSQKMCNPTETPPLPMYQCISCERFDSSGDCDAGYRKYCEGQWCTKTIGYVNGRWLESRGCAPINPSSHQLCVMLESSHAMSQLSNRPINFPYSLEQCFCTGQDCNSATGVGTGMFGGVAIITTIALLLLMGLMGSSCQ